MPSQCPIGCGTFVEQNRTNRPCVIAEQIRDAGGLRSEQFGETFNSVQSYARPIPGQFRDDRFEPRQKWDGRAVQAGRPMFVEVEIQAQSFSVSSGMILNRSPTRPMSATWKIGASSSLLIAMIVFESFMPARCWIAPEMPIAI